MFQCRRDKCKKNFSNSSNQFRHEKKCDQGDLVLVEKPKSFTCSNVWCNKHFDNKFNYERHQSSCKIKVGSSYSCSVCDKVYAKKSKLLRHELVHNMKEMYICEKCTATYVRHDKYQLHLKQCNGASSKSNLTMVDLYSNTNSECPSSSTIVSGVLNFPCNNNNNVNHSNVDGTNSSVLVQVDTAPDGIGNTFDGDDDTLVVHVESDTADADGIGSNFDGDCDTLFGPVPSTTTVPSVIAATLNGNFDTLFVPVRSATVPNGIGSSFDSDCNDGVQSDTGASCDSKSCPSVLPVESDTVQGEGGIGVAFDFKSKVADDTIRYLKLLRNKAKRSVIKRKEFAKMFIILFGGDYNNHDFMFMLATILDFSTVSDLKDYIDLDKIEDPTYGRPKIHMQVRQKLYDHWLDNSTLCTDRRNGRHVIKIKQSKLNSAVTDLVDSNISTCNTKRGSRQKAQKLVYNRPIRELFQSFLKRNTSMKVSIGLFYNCKPFYVSPANERELAGCLCAKCLNPHCLYDVIRKHVDELPYSLTEYLTGLFQCSKDSDINYPRLDCINGTCKNHCRIINDLHKKFNWGKKISYYQFEKAPEFYFDRNGVKKVYFRTKRIDYSASLLDVYELLQEEARDYLTHRYNASCNKVYWDKYLQETEDYVLWMDYSMNIALVPKSETQGAHYSGKQHTLHDMLIRKPKTDKYTYVYHLSDDTNHDSVFTSNVLSDVIDKHPEIIASGQLTLRADNCSTQYKSRFVFKVILDLAKKHDITITWFYGEAGHGRGLIDAMAWFGCKGPLRRAIVQDEIWFPTADTMVDHLNTHFHLDDRKEFYLIKQEKTAAERRKGREDRRVKGCSAAHIISFHTDGSVKLQNSARYKLVGGKLEELEGKPQNANEEIEDAEDVDFDPDTDLPHEKGYDEMHLDASETMRLIKENSYIAIRAPPNSLELFYVMKVLRKEIAQEKISDPEKKHFILKDEQYIVGKWFSLDREGKKAVKYKEAKKTLDAFIHTQEIFSTDVELDENLNMDINSYRMLCCASF